MRYLGAVQPAGLLKKAKLSHEKLRRSMGQERKQIFLILTSSDGLRADIDYRPSDHCDTVRISVVLGFIPIWNPQDYDGFKLMR